MATCKICGKQDGSLPDWKNWDCLECFGEELRGNGEPSYEVYEQQIAMMRTTRDGISQEIVDREIALEVAKANHDGKEAGT